MVILLAAALFLDPVFAQGTETSTKAVFTTELRDDGFEDRVRFAWAPNAAVRVGASLPFVGRSDRVNRRTGVGDLALEARGVLRDWERTRVALDATLGVPTGASHGHLAPGTGSTSFAGAFVVAHVRERLLFSAGARGVLELDAGRDSASLEAVAGAWLSRKERTDVLLLLESEAIRLGPERRGGSEVLFARRERTLSLAPSLALRVDRMRLKGGITFPVVSDAREPRWRLAIALEVAQ